MAGSLDTAPVAVLVTALSTIPHGLCLTVDLLIGLCLVILFSLVGGDKNFGFTGHQCRSKGSLRSTPLCGNLGISGNIRSPSFSIFTIPHGLCLIVDLLISLCLVILVCLFGGDKTLRFTGHKCQRQRLTLLDTLVWDFVISGNISSLSINIERDKGAATRLQLQVAFWRNHNSRLRGNSCLMKLACILLVALIVRVNFVFLE